MKPRVVFDTSTVFSALLFAGGKIAWLREHWREGGCTPLVSRATAAELIRVLAYPRFRLSPDDRSELLADYLPYCQILEVTRKCRRVCRDPNDQPFLDLAESGNADLLVSSDNDLLALAGKTKFSIETPAAYRRRIQWD